jgi:uncharacterized DUF497 family protein
VPRFSWDKQKAAANKRKHGVSFSEAASVFEDPFAQDLPDLAHGDRSNVLGLTRDLQLVVVVYAGIDNGVRIISARRATKHERRQYEEDD